MAPLATAMLKFRVQLTDDALTSLSLEKLYARLQRKAESVCVRRGPQVWQTLCNAQTATLMLDIRFVDDET